MILEELKKIVQEEREKGKKIVFTNGCFDILHIGHVRYLKEAKALGDILIVGLNSDNSVRALKGEGRPVNSQQDRAEILLSLRYVDYVIIFEELDPLKLIEALEPDYLVKGGDWTKETVVGREIVEKRGGKVVIATKVGDVSTSKLMLRIRHTLGSLGIGIWPNVCKPAKISSATVPSILEGELRPKL